MKKLVLAALVAVCLALAGVSGSAHAARADTTQKLLVGFKAALAQSDSDLVKRLGGVVRRSIPEADALAINLPESKRAELAKAIGVEYVEEDAIRYPLGLADAQLSPSLTNGLYGLLTTKATIAQSRGITGAGVKACVADTGLDYTHPDIAPNYVAGIDTVANPDDNDPWWGGDPNEVHGTHVSGTILGAFNSVGVFGVAYNAKLYYARVLGPSGGTSSDIMAGVRWLVEQQGCKIVNMSLGGSLKLTTENRFYKQMRQRGALIVAAAGNDGAKRLSYPAGYAVNLSVGAVDVNNAHASFSNTGKGLDLSAPGVLVLSSVPSGMGSEAQVNQGANTYRAFGLETAAHTTAAGITGKVVDCGTGAVGSCPAGIAGNVALIQRGTNTFADKITNAKNQGAVAAIIYNNVAGDFTGTVDGAVAPIAGVSVSAATGAALKAQAGNNVTVVNLASAWDHFDGTSMATPHVSGVAALVWQKFPTFTAAQVESRLTSTATDLGTPGLDSTFGFGLVNADTAVGP